MITFVNRWIFWEVIVFILKTCRIFCVSLASFPSGLMRVALGKIDETLKQSLHGGSARSALFHFGCEPGLTFELEFKKIIYWNG